MNPVSAMNPMIELSADADADGTGVSGGVQIHVEITPLGTTGPIDPGLPATGADLPVLLIVAGLTLLVVGALMVARKVRRWRRTVV